MNINQLVTKAKALPNCIVLPSSGLPQVENDLTIPDDIKEFYNLCGGMALFEGAAYAVRIVKPEEVVFANPIIIGEDIINAEIQKGTYEGEISRHCFIIADLYNSDYIVIDFNKERVGQCYKAFWDGYPEVGGTPIVAKSFTELLERFIDNGGDYWYFLKDDFVSYGDAYDGIVD